MQYDGNGRLAWMFDVSDISDLLALFIDSTTPWTSSNR